VSEDDHKAVGESKSVATPGDRELDFHPGMGMRWEITRSAEDTAGELFESKNWLDPRMAGPPVHVHPDAEESFEVIEGVLDVFIEGEWSSVGAGETATVPAGVPHTLRNATDEPVTAFTRIRPAGRSEAFFHDMHALIREGKVKRLPPKEPRSAIYAAMLFGKYPDVIRPTKPPNQVFQTLARVGRALRFKI
jgi:mannose-6-phosphate isomerase-like protein (cupin superfamily)